MPTIAGHTFVWGWCSCGVSWRSIRDADENAFQDSYCPDPEKPEKRWKKWAHTGLLNGSELSEIREERKAEEERAMAATKALGDGSRGYE